MYEISSGSQINAGTRKMSESSDDERLFLSLGENVNSHERTIFDAEVVKFNSERVK